MTGEKPIDSPPTAAPATRPRPLARAAIKQAAAKAARREASQPKRVMPAASTAPTRPRSSSPRAAPLAETSAQTANTIANPPKDRHCTYPPTVSRRVGGGRIKAVSYTHLRAHETRHDLVCRLLLEK